MKTTHSTYHKFIRMFANILSILAIVAIAIPVTAVAYAASQSPFLGKWEATDTDGSNMMLSIGGRSTGPFQITWMDSYFSRCSGEAGIVRGTGWLDNDPDVLNADLQLECFTTGTTLDSHIAFQYHPDANTLSIKWSYREVTIWYRPGTQPATPPVLNLRVNYGHDWVESFYEGGHTAWVTVTDSDGNVRATNELVTESKDYWGGATGFQSLDSTWFDGDGNQMESPPDIQPYDWVYGWMDNGASAQVQIGEISGEINLSTDSISGTIMAPWFTNSVQVECLDWGSGQESPFDNVSGGTIPTDGDAFYACSWENWDIQPGQTIGVGYVGPDGHWVANSFFVTNPTFVAYVPGAIEGYDWPMGNTITININNGEYTAQALSEQRPDSPEGTTRVLFELWRDNFSIKTGDQIVMTDGTITKDTAVTDLAVTDIDVSRGTVSGIYDPAYSLWVWLYGRDGQVPVTDPDNGTWVATFDQLPLGAWGGATQWEMDGDGTSIDFQVPESIVWAAAYTYDVGTWTEGTHTYHFEAEWNGGSEIAPEVSFEVSNEASPYYGYVLLRGLALRANVDGTCPVIDPPIIRADQLTRFHTGYTTDYPMTYAEAQVYFDSLTAKVVWDGGQLVELSRHEIIPYQEDDWPSYYCTFTE